MSDVYGAATRVASVDDADMPATSLHQPTVVVELFMAGDIDSARQIVRLFVKECPCCVTVSETTFIYRGGEERGFVVGFRNYPRFPADGYTLRRMAGDLGDRLLLATGQDSYMVVDAAGMTTWRTTRHA
jgi:hypothetical protein